MSCHFLLQGIFPTQELNISPALAVRFFTTELPGKPLFQLLLLQVTSVVSNSVRPHRRQPTRLLHPWDSPGKKTGVGCHFLLQCIKVKSESEVAQLCPTLSDPTDCTLPGSCVHGILQARVLECHFPIPSSEVGDRSLHFSGGYAAKWI